MFKQDIVQSFLSQTDSRRKNIHRRGCNVFEDTCPHPKDVILITSLRRRHDRAAGGSLCGDKTATASFCLGL